MISDMLSRQIQVALKGGDSLRVSTLRLLSSVLHNEEIDKHRKLTDEEELVVVRRQIKQREEAIELYKRGGRQDLVDKETEEAKILKEFLPEQMTGSQITQIVEEEIARIGVSGPGDFGKLMGAVMSRIGGKADGKVVAEIVRKILSTKSEIRNNI